ncbi:hypothetical protein LEN26_008284 [Aphanomyces euteiches]|nr:hypothetical protein AeMF1_013971 [Aphanomyces euteiches]KAH9130700.1 hypothetical protein LEN26_008284 [Aphanomyces euteiches]
MFLILSGFVLSVKFFERLEIIEQATRVRDVATVRQTYVEAYHSIASTGLRRVPRFCGPVLVAVPLIIFNRWFHNENSKVLELIVDVVKTLFCVQPSYNFPLWTLRVELEGSVFTLALCVILSRFQYAHRVVICLILLPIYHNQWANWNQYVGHFYGCFVLGMLLANIVSHQMHVIKHGEDQTTVATGLFSRKLLTRVPSTYISLAMNICYTLAFLLAAWLFIYRTEYDSDYGLWKTLVHAIFEKEHQTFIWRLASCIIIYTVCWSPWLQLVFASRLARYLGRISFLLYVLHWPITMFAVDFVKPWLLATGWTDESAKRMSGAISYLISNALAHFCTIYIDEPYVKWLATMEKRLHMQMDTPEANIAPVA